MRIHVDTAMTIAADADTLAALYLDYTNWSRLFPATIRGVTLVHEEAGATTVEVDHRTAGRVINIIKPITPTEIVLEEFKPLFTATFVNHFEAFGDGARYTVIAEVHPKMPYALLSPVLGWYAEREVRRHVLEPMRDYAEHVLPRHESTTSG